MKITCGSCAAKYTVSDEKVTGKTVKVKCRKCGAVIVVSSSGDVQTTGGSAGGGGGGGDVTYTVSVSDTDQRNMQLHELIAAYNEGIIDAETYVWAEGMDDWLPLKDVDSIVDALHEAAQSESAGGDLGATVAMPESPYDSGGGGYPAPRAPAPRADHFGAGTVAMGAGSGGGYSGGGYSGSGGGGGLFDAASSSPSDGTTGGFFGSGGGGGGGLSEPAATGAENSAIFSLNMLTQKAATPGSGGGGGGGGNSSGGGTTEDSGLIDLKALAAGMGGDDAHGGVAAPPADGGLFPFGAPMANSPAAMPSIPIPEARPSSNRGMVIGLAGAVILLGAALVFILVRDSGPPTPTADTSTATTAPPTTTTEVAETTTTTTAPVADTTAPAGSASGQPKIAVGPRPVGKPGPAAQPGPQPKGQPKSQPPTATKGKCGCASDDLMCHMRCSQK